VTGQPCLLHYDALSPQRQAKILAGFGLRI
jgi:hypothetical protein